MSKFSEIFSTTLKVVAALCLISIGIGVICLVITRIGHSNDAASARQEIDRLFAAEYKEADDIHASMPKSRWDKLNAAAIKQGCAMKGMAKDDVEKALGRASQVGKGFDGSETWTYLKVDMTRCAKYSGDTCSEYEQEKSTVSFSPNGYKTLHDSGRGCYDEPFYSLRTRMMSN